MATQGLYSLGFGSRKCGRAFVAHSGALLFGLWVFKVRAGVCGQFRGSTLWVLGLESVGGRSWPTLGLYCLGFGSLKCGRAFVAKPWPLVFGSWVFDVRVGVCSPLLGL